MKIGNTAGTGFPLVLIDAQMPEIDGFSVAEQIRKTPELAGAAVLMLTSGSGTHLPVIAMTANAMKGDEERCLAPGMDGYVSKPIQVEQLFATIDDVLS